MKRAYTVSFEDDEFSEGVIANSAKEAKLIAWKESEWLRYNNDPYIELKVKWVKDAIVDNIAYGLITDNWVEALKAKVFGFVIAECPICHDETELWLFDGGVVSCGCHEENDYSPSKSKDKEK